MIFNKGNAGSVELKELIGFVYKSINFSNLTTYISFAERYIKKIISPEVFSVAEVHYNSDHYHYTPDDETPPDPPHPEYALLDELVAKIQFPVAINAYRKYVPSSDLIHSDKGRQIFVSEQEKPAFEWQIEKDNENLITLEHEAIDVLLEFLDANLDTTYADDDDEGTQIQLLPWGTTDAFKATRELFIPNVEEFEKVFLIGGSRMTYLSLVPFIRSIQDNDIRPCLGEDRYCEIKEQFIDGDISADNKIILDKLCPPLGLLSLSLAVKRLSAEVLPSGIFTRITANVIKGKTPASKQDRNEIASSFEKDGQHELLKLQEYLRKIDTAASGETFTAMEPKVIDPLKKFVRL